MPSPAAARQPEHLGGSWFASPLAQRLLREEQRQAASLLTSCYGQIGLYARAAENAPADLSGNSLQSVLRVHRDASRLAGDLHCHDVELPFLRESVDMVYLLHALEGCAEPHAWLMEIERVLTPEGNLMLVVLNPYSLWRLRWTASGLRAPGAGSCRAMLRDTGFEVMQQRGVGPMLPWLRDHQWTAGPESEHRDLLSVWRAGYLIHARKRRRSLTPVRPRAAVVFAPGMGPG